MVDHSDGSFTCTLTDRADIRKAHEMEAGIDRIDVERGAEVQASLERETVYMNGEKREVAAQIVEQTKHKFGSSPRATFGPPRGGWPTFGPDGKVVE